MSDSTFRVTLRPVCGTICQNISRFIRRVRDVRCLVSNEVCTVTPAVEELEKGGDDGIARL